MKLNSLDSAFLLCADFLYSHDGVGFTRALEKVTGLSLPPVVFSKDVSPLEIELRDISKSGYIAVPIVDLAGMLRLIQTAPFIKLIFESKLSTDLAFSLGDYGKSGQISFCANTIDQALVPDCEFIYYEGYKEMRIACLDQVAWCDRLIIPYWRGSTTGDRAQDQLFSSLPRVQLCNVGKAHGYDFAITKAVQCSLDEGREIEQSAIFSEPKPWHEVLKRRYNIDIDGNSSAWTGLFQKLLAGGVVLKVESSFKQWYYRHLRPWHNFVPIRSDFSDLATAVCTLEKDPLLAKSIAANGRALALTMTYEQSMKIGLQNVIEHAKRLIV